MFRSIRLTSLGFFLILVLFGCDSSFQNDPPDLDITCEIPTEQIFQGCNGGRDCIPSLSNPLFVDKENVTYLRDTDRVLGLLLNGEPIAIPHNILWWHEIVNLDQGSESLAVTYCPLTGSTISIDRSDLDGVEFGVSGLLYKTNLIMYDRKNPSSLWPQMSLASKCGDATGTQLTTSPIFEMNWKGWTDLYPNTKVISEATGHSRDYERYPYNNYETIDNENILFPFGKLDDRRPPKERVLGIRTSTGSMAFPFGEFEEKQENQIVEVELDGNNIAIFWDAEKEAAIAFNTFVEGVIAHFEVQDGKFVDTSSGSVWSIDGRAIDGPLAGSVIEQVPNSYIAFWFAWAAFHDQVDIWESQ